MPERSALREALSEFLGQTQFHKFVQTGVRRGRLKYWQEEAWSRFVAARPDMGVGLEELAAALRICELHGRELLAGTAKVFHGCVDYAPVYIVTRNKLFPHAAVDIVSTEGAPFAGDNAQIWYCTECREAHVEWMKKRDSRG